MKILSSGRQHYAARVSIFLIVIALIAGMIGCGNGDGDGDGDGRDGPYYLTITSTSGGHVLDPGEDLFQYYASEVPLVCEADLGYRFVGWSGDVDTIDNVYKSSTSIAVNKDIAITAVFLPLSECWSLVTYSGEGGSVTTPGEGKFYFQKGQVVPLEATPDNINYGFGAWSEEYHFCTDTIADVNDATTTITMTADYIVKANFYEHPR